MAVVLYSTVIEVRFRDTIKSTLSSYYYHTTTTKPKNAQQATTTAKNESMYNVTYVVLSLSLSLHNSTGIEYVHTFCIACV